MESRRPGGYDVNDTAAETAALHSGKLQARATPAPRAGTFRGNNFRFRRRRCRRYTSGRDGARPSHSSFVTRHCAKRSPGGFAAFPTPYCLLPSSRLTRLPGWAALPPCEL